MKHGLAVLAGLALLAGCGGPPVASVSAELASASKPEKAASKMEALSSFVEKHKDSPDPKVQDLVARGGIKLGYAQAESGSFEKARETFIEAADSYKGTGQMDPAFGALDDQAAYQAVVCLAADGNDKEAIAELQAFIKERPLSPLVYAAHKRLILMDGENRERYDAILQDAKARQEKEGRLAMARCGPLAAAELLRLSGKPVPDIKTLEKDSGMTESGASMAGLAKALLKQGLLVEGRELNFSDFKAAKTPFIWLTGEHFVVVTSISQTAEIFDPFLKGARKVALPKEASSFRASTLIPSSN